MIEEVCGDPEVIAKLQELLTGTAEEIYLPKRYYDCIVSKTARVFRQEYKKMVIFRLNSADFWVAKYVLFRKEYNWTDSNIGPPQARIF